MRLERICHHARKTEREIPQRAVWIQHGDNPECRRLFTFRGLVEDEGAIRKWVEEVHKYEALKA